MITNPLCTRCVGAPVRERPILFSAPMVRAILEGRKTQTRRVMKPQPLGAPPKIGCHELDGGRYGFFDEERDFACPYGAPGDRLWVKETWQARIQTSHECDEWYLCDGPPRELRDRFGDPEIEYKATSPGLGPWRPSIFMPRWASRITLEVVSVRVERLHDISEEGAIAEGIKRGEYQGEPVHWRNYLATSPVDLCASPIESYRSLWESINGLGSWDANPWVWVVEFERCREAA